MKYYWKIKRENLKYLPKNFLTEDQYNYLYLDFNYIEGYIYVSKYNNYTSSWMKYNQSSSNWYRNNNFEYLGEFKSPIEIRKDKLQKIKNL